SLGEHQYAVFARFSSVGDLKRGDAVKLAGVQVGEVKRLGLVDYTASVELSISEPLQIPKDTIASIQTAGLLGDAYVSLSPGASGESLAAGGTIAHTEPAISISELLAKYAFGSLTEGSEGSAQRGATSAKPAEPDLLQ
ncbi:MAG TPA: MlaD family protein, partial [Polyangiaceae bacterium]|nr:MlaD family protein [Polyangiaceae bacterium]